MPFNVNRTKMLQEIKEQPQTLRDTIDSVAMQVDNVRQIFKTNRTTSCGSIFLIGCGTSYHAAIAAKHALRGYAGIASVAYPASEFRDFELKRRGDIVIAISQSGETGDVLTAVKQASKEGCIIIAVTNEAKSTLAELGETTVLTRAGRELAIPMTKTYTALLVALFSIAEALGWKNQGVSHIQEIPMVVEQTIKDSKKEIEKMSHELKGEKAILLLGRGPNYATALEASLKLKEAALFHAEAFHSPEFRHGPKAMLEAGIAVVAFTNRTEFDDTTLRLLEDIQNTGARVITVGDRVDSTIVIQPLPYHLTPIPDIIPLQLLSVHLAAARGINPDNPRSLAKVTTAT